MTTYIAAIAKSVGDTADLIHRSAVPLDADGARPVPAFLKQELDDIHTQIINGRPFSMKNLPAYVDAVENLNGAGIDDRKFLLEKVLVLMSRLPSDSQFSKSLQQFTIDILYKDLPHPPASYLSLPPSTAPTSPSPSPAYAYAYRTNDGSHYNPLFPAMGMAGTPYARSVPTTHAISRQALPDAGIVFDTLLSRGPSSSTTTSYANDNANGYANGNPNGSIDAGFTPHPGGISSFFFAFADLIIHSVFNSSPAPNSTINRVSSYLDLSPLYGSSSAEVDLVRRRDGRGTLWEDVFADARVLGMPPSVCALLILFCRNHNFIADKLLSINESGTFRNPESLSNEARAQQDDELFARARLVNCGFFMQIILGDYVGAILGLVRDGLDWRLDPLAPSRELSHSVSPRGEGNVVSIEFNLLYRWHAALSQPDTAWTEKLFHDMFPGKTFSEITVQELGQAVRQYMSQGTDVTKWTFDGSEGEKLARDPNTGRFADGDLAAILQNATDASASAFKARGIPEVLRVVEVMGIEQGRSWGACSLNEFRKFMGLKPYSTFKEWNPDPSIHTAAEKLYTHIDNLELHVGMQAEEAKPAIPGSGLCPGYTISRAILADAVALTRGDRFLTTDFTTFNLTSWGYQDCFPDKNDGSYGGMLTRLLFRTLPDHYPASSAYAHFPFLVPSKVKGFLTPLKESPVAKYTFTRPAVPEKTLVVRDWVGVKDVLERKGVWADDVEQKVAVLLKGGNFDMKFVDKLLSSPSSLQTYSNIFLRTTSQLIKDKTVDHVLQPLKYVDIVKDVINIVPVHFIATYLAGIPIKTTAYPRGVYRENELFEMFSDVCNYVSLNINADNAWVLREKSSATAEIVATLICHRLEKISGSWLSFGAIADSFTQWVTDEDVGKSNDFLSHLSSTSSKSDVPKLKPNEIANSIFATTVTTAALYSKAVTHVVDFYLDHKNKVARGDIERLCSDQSPESNAALMKYVLEALRINPPVPGIMRTARTQTNLQDGSKVQPGQHVYCSIATANLDESVFGAKPVAASYDRQQTGILGMGDHGLVNWAFFEATVPQVLRAIFSLKNLKRTPGKSGVLNKFTQNVYECPETAYINFKGQITPWPVSLVVQYET